MTAPSLPAAADAATVDGQPDPEAWIIACCDTSRAVITAALDRGDLDALLQVRKQGVAVRRFVFGRQYGPAAQMAALEVGRRAERALAIGVRQAQAGGTMLAHGETRGSRAYVHGRSNQPVAAHDRVGAGKRAPGDYVGSGGTRSDIYRMADGVSDEEFEQAVKTARAMGNMTRSNLVRQIQIAAGWEPRKAGRPIIGRACPGPLPDFARESAWALRRATERAERIFADDRFGDDKRQVATHMRSHLEYTAQVCQDLLGRLRETDRSLPKCPPARPPPRRPLKAGRCLLTAVSPPSS